MKSEPRLSDHALIRYIERVIGIDLDPIRRDIMTDAVKAAIDAGVSTVTVAGAQFKVRGGVIVTVLNKVDKPRLKTGKPGARFKGEVA